MIRRLLYRLTARLPCRLISRDGAPYLERYLLARWRGRHVYLHRFVSGDGDQEVHDHPWRALAIVLAGSYVEHRAHLSGRAGILGPMRWVSWVNFIGLHTLHRIISTEPNTWTLFIAGRRRKGWGFFRRIDTDTASAVMYHQPFRTWRGEDWTTAPRGENAGRAPMEDAA